LCKGGRKRDSGGTRRDWDSLGIMVENPLVLMATPCLYGSKRLRKTDEVGEHVPEGYIMTWKRKMGQEEKRVSNPE